MSQIIVVPTAFEALQGPTGSRGDRLPPGIAIPLIIGMSVAGWVAVWQFVEWTAWLLV